MAFDEELAERTRAALSGRAGLTERKMFGGLAFMISGNMCCGIIGDELMVRVGADAYEANVQRRYARAMDFTGRAMKGMVYVDAEGVRTARALKTWVDRGVAFAGSLPPK